MLMFISVNKVWVFILVAGVLSLMFNFYHLLTMLLSMEFISLNLYWIFFFSVYDLGFDSFYSLYILIMIVSEGALGLILLIMVSFNYSSDYLYSIDLVW